MGKGSQPPKWIKPQLTRLADEAPAGDDWLHEIKYDGYRMHARIEGRDIKLLTRPGLDWSHRYRRTIEALGSLKMKSALPRRRTVHFERGLRYSEQVAGNGPQFRA